MNSFLNELAKNYELFLATNGEIIQMFHFPDDINDTWYYLLAKANPQYFKRCGEMGRNIHQIKEVKLNKDASGKCYLTIFGNDDHTVLIIRSNDSNYEDYRTIAAKKITEEEFINELDFIQRKKLISSKVAKRFIRDEALPLNICEEMNISLLISYYRYLNDYLNPVEVFDEPENTVGPAQKSNPSLPRKNPIIDLDARQTELLKRDPKKIIKLKGNKSGSRFDAYVYERDGFVLAVIEPESGTEYQYNLNLGNIDYNDEKLVRSMLKAALEAREDIAMLDDAIMRKNHTTLATFIANLDIFLDNAKSGTKFYYDVAAAKNVYHR